MISSHPNITILVDNVAPIGLQTAHGLALWIEHDGRHILFDTGPDDVVLTNAQVLGIDLAASDHLVLSHGHSDHSGGIAHILRQARKLSVHCHPGAVHPRYAIREGIPKPLRMPQDAMIGLDRLPHDRMHWLQRPVQLTEHIGLTGHIPRATTFEPSGGPFYLDPDGRRPDPIDDEIALWIRTAFGLVVCVGCAHAGLINTLEYVQRINQGRRISAIIGGLHLRGADDHQLLQTVAALQRFRPDLVIPCHCTGKRAIDLMHHNLGDRVRIGYAGMCCLERWPGPQGSRQRHAPFSGEHQAGRVALETR